MISCRPVHKLAYRVGDVVLYAKSSVRKRIRGVRHSKKSNFFWFPSGTPPVHVLANIHIHIFGFTGDLIVCDSYIGSRVRPRYTYTTLATVHCAGLRRRIIQGDENLALQRYFGITLMKKYVRSAVLVAQHFDHPAYYIYIYVSIREPSVHYFYTRVLFEKRAGRKRLG